MMEDFVSFQLLRTKFDGHIPYEELLLTREWQEKRYEVLKLDNWKCSNCFKVATDSSNDNQVHFWWKETNDIEKIAKIFRTKKEEDDVLKKMTIEKRRALIVSPVSIIPEILPSDKPYFLQIHHNYYIKNKLPWEYSNEALITLCNWCHWDFHQNNRVPFYETEEKLTKLQYTLCHRCSGSGWFPEFKHVESGICFHCRGEKYVELIR